MKGLVLPAGPAQLAHEGKLERWRVPIKPQPPEDYSRLEVGLYHPTQVDRHGEEYPGEERFGAWTLDGECGWPCPFGAPGASLYVRETCSTEEYLEYDPSGGYSMTTGELKPYRYRAAGQSPYDNGWIASTSMHEGASRTLLELTSVEVNRIEHHTGRWEWALGLKRVEAEAAA